jgi:chromosome partitioning protein
MPDSNENKKPFVIAIANEKGGVGKTTTALAVGTILAQRGHKVLCVDLDPQGNLTLSLGYKPHDLSSPSSDLPTAGTLFARDAYSTNTENLDVTFFRTLIINENHQIQVNTGDESYFLSQDLNVIAQLPYDYIIIDCPPSIGKIIINTLLISDFLIIPSQADFFAVYALKVMMELIGKVRQEGNSDLPYRILITLFDTRNHIYRIIKNQLDLSFGSGMFKTFIELDTKIRETAILGFPATNSRGVKQYRSLVDELVEDIQKIQSA